MQAIKLLLCVSFIFGCNSNIKDETEEKASYSTSEPEDTSPTVIDETNTDKSEPKVDDKTNNLPQIPLTKPGKVEIDRLFNLGAGQYKINFSFDETADGYKIYYTDHDKTYRKSVDVDQNTNTFELPAEDLNKEIKLSVVAYNEAGEAEESDGRYAYTSEFTTLPLGVNREIAKPWVNDLSVDKNGSLHIASFGEGIVSKAENGATYLGTTHAQGFSSHDSFFVSSTDTHIVTSTPGDGIFLSEDGGKSYRSIVSSLDKPNFFWPYDLEILNNTILTVNTDNTYANLKARMSTDFGESWTEIDDTNTGGALQINEDVNRVCITGTNILLLTSTAVLISEDNAATWTRVLHNKNNIDELECGTYSSNNYAVVSTTDDGLAIIPDLSNPTVSDIPISTPGYLNDKICYTMVVKNSNFHLVCYDTLTYDRFLLSSLDFGVTWSSVQSDTVGIPYIYNIFESRNKIYVYGNELFEWNEGSTFIEVFPATTNKPPIEMTFSRSNSGITSNVGWVTTYGNGVYRTEDYITWQNIVPDSISNADQSHVAKTLLGYDIIGTEAGLYVRAVGDTGSWNRLTTSRIYDLTAYDNKFYIATRYQGLITYDSSWNQLSVEGTGEGLPQVKVNDLSVKQDKVWVATDLGIVSRDLSGTNWTTYTNSDGLIGNRHTWIEHCNDMIYASPERFEEYSIKGLSFSKDGGLTWEGLNTGQFDRYFDGLYCDGNELWASARDSVEGVNKVLYCSNMTEVSPTCTEYNSTMGASHSQRLIPNWGFEKAADGMYIFGAYHTFFKPD